MNKQQLIGNLKSFCQKHDIDINDVWVSHGGACVLLGIREETTDIDLNAPEHIYKKFLNGKYPTREVLNPSTGEVTTVISVEGLIDMHLGYRSVVSTSLMSTDGVLHTDQALTLADKQQLNRDKDQEDIRRLSSFCGADILSHLGEILKPKYNDRRFVRKVDNGVYLEADDGVGIEIHRIDSNINVVYLDDDNVQHQLNYRNIDVFFCSVNSYLAEIDKDIVDDGRYTLVEILYNHELITAAERYFWRKCNQVNSRIVDVIRLIESKYCQIYCILEILYLRGLVSIVHRDGETKLIVYGNRRQGDLTYLNRKAVLVRQQLMMLLGINIDIIVLTEFDIRLSGYTHTDIVAYFDQAVNPVVKFNS